MRGRDPRIHQAKSGRWRDGLPHRAAAAAVRQWRSGDCRRKRRHPEERAAPASRGMRRRTSRCRQRVDFRVGREAAERLLGKSELTVDQDFEHAAAGADEFDFGVGEFLQSCPRTEGFGFVASNAAVLNNDLHVLLLLNGPLARRQPPGR